MDSKISGIRRGFEIKSPSPVNRCLYSVSFVLPGRVSAALYAAAASRTFREGKAFSPMDADAGRRSRFAEDEGLAYLADAGAGFSGKGSVFCTSPDRRLGLGALSARSAVFYSARGEEPRHFLDACFLCKQPLGEDRDIFMYRGDTPFCSEECRQEQIEIDEAKEKNWSLPMKVSSKTENQKSPSKNQNYRARTGTVAAG